MITTPSAYTVRRKKDNGCAPADRNFQIPYFSMGKLHVITTMHVILLLVTQY